jgi:hypothetical protein
MKMDRERSSLALVTKITDWIDGTNELRHGYDVTPLARLTTITDYDDSTLRRQYSRGRRPRDVLEIVSP